jgi:putative aldouronate transport system substrate-binding protein
MRVGTKAKGMTMWSCLLALLLSQLVIACGGNSGNTSNGPVDLTLWSYQAVTEVGSPPANWEVLKQVREKLNINLKVVFIPQGDAGDAKVSADAAANNLADLFQITSNNLFLKWVQLGLIAPVDSLYAQMPNRTKDRYSDPTMQKLGTINGKPYVLQEKTPLDKRVGLLIRKDWLDKLHLQAPKTLDDFLNVAKAFTTEDPDGNGKNDTYGFGALTTSSEARLGNNFNAIFGAFGLPGVWNYNTPGKISLSVRDPNYLKAVEFVKSLADSKVIDPDWTTLSTSDFRARWKQGKYGMMQEDFCAAICQANYQAFDTNYPNGIWEPLTPPQGPDGKSMEGYSVSVGSRYAVSQKAMSAGKGKAIADLLEWLNSGDGYYLAGFGNKDVNYKLDAQGNVTTVGAPTPFTTHEAAPLTQLRNWVYNNSAAELKVRYPSHTTKNGRKIDPVAVYQQFASMPWQDQTSTYAILPASNQADINRYVDEGLVQFITGQKSLDAESWAAFVQGLDGLNASDWEAAANQALKDKSLL